DLIRELCWFSPRWLRVGRWGTAGPSALYGAGRVADPAMDRLVEGGPMRNGIVADVMTTEVVAVVPGTPYVDVVRALEGWRISGLPVVDGDRRVIGVVSESDLLHKQELRGQRHRPVVEGRPTRLARAKAAGDTAGELMTAPAITVRPTDTLVSAAWVLARHR